MAKKIKVNIFDDMREALQDAAAYERGQAVNLRITRIPARPRQISPKEVRRIRLTLNASQTLFATFLNVSPNAVRSWEQGTRRPRQARETDHRAGLPSAGGELREQGARVELLGLQADQGVSPRSSAAGRPPRRRR